MPSQRCSTCARNYPINVRNCPTCGGPTWRLREEDPDGEPRGSALQDEEYELRGDAPLLYDYDLDGKIVGWRLKMFFDLGFDVVNATALALRRDVDRQQVSDLLAAGATPQQVTGILL